MYSRYSTSVYQPGLFYLGCFFQHPKGHRAAGLRQGRSISSRQGTGTPGMLTSLGTQPVMFSAQAHASWGTVCNPTLSVSHLLASHTYFLPPSLTFPSPSPWSPSPFSSSPSPLQGQARSDAQVQVSGHMPALCSGGICGTWASPIRAAILYLPADDCICPNLLAWIRGCFISQ